MPGLPATILLVGLSTPDQKSLGAILRNLGWIPQRAASISSALASLRRKTLPVVITERYLPDGDWYGLLISAQDLPRAPRIVVSNRLANDRFWAEVLNLGGFDLLSPPFQERDVDHVISHAWGSWHREWRPTGRLRFAAQPAC